MADFTIKGTSVSHEAYNSVVTLHCQIPNSGESHDVKVYVSNILMAERGIKGNNSAIVRTARSWAEPTASQGRGNHGRVRTQDAHGECRRIGDVPTKT